MGGVVSGKNVSVTDLDVFQQAINKVGQDIRSKAQNDAIQSATIKQQINFSNGPPIHPCETYTLQQSNCDLQCRIDNRGPVYQCQFRVADGRLPSNETNAESCNVMYGTREQALNYSDGICDGTADMNENEREQVCFKRAIRLTCPNNPPVLSPTNIECANASICGSGGSCISGVCMIPSGLNGEPSESACEDGCGQLTYINKIDLGNGKFAYDYENGGLPITNPGTGNGWIPIDGKSIFDCVQADAGGANRLNGVPLSDCLNDCASNYACPDDIQAQDPIPPRIECEGGLCIGNTADVTMTSEQLADSSIKAEMLTDISNDFQSEVLKSISQVNENLNIQQFNNSLEMTEISQSIKNSISNSLDSQSLNTSQQQGNVLQVINFRNDGVIHGSPASPCVQSEPDYSSCDTITDDTQRQDCQRQINESFVQNLDAGCADFDSLNDGSGCGCSITNNTALEISNKQQAKSVVDSVFNSSIVNNLASKYTFELDQRNTGINIAWIILPICVIIASIAYVIAAFLRSFNKIAKGVAIFLVIAAVIGGGIAIWKITTKEDPNDQCPSSTEPPSSN